MYRSLLLKECRELAIWASVGMVILALMLITDLGLNLWTMAATYRSPIPFIDTAWQGTLLLVGGGLATVLALRQTVGESVQGTWLLLLHRPVPRQRLIAVKMIAGAVVLLVATLIPLLGMMVWAALPGTHASPFYWIFTAPAWPLWLALTTAYLGGFLTGMRDVHWVGTRLLPLAGTLVLLLFIWALVGSGFLIWPLVAILIANSILLAAIFEISSTRDFAG